MSFFVIGSRCTKKTIKSTAIQHWWCIFLLLPCQTPFILQSICGEMCPRPPLQVVWLVGSQWVSMVVYTVTLVIQSNNSNINFNRVNVFYIYWPIAGSQGGGAFPRWHRPRGRVTHGWVASSSQGQHSDSGSEERLFSTTPLIVYTDQNKSSVALLQCLILVGKPVF